MYFADVPKCVMRSASANSQSTRPRDTNGEPSNSSSVAPAASPRDEPVPHHPAAGGEVEQPVAGLHVAVQTVLLQVLEQDAASAVHDALRHAGRSRRVHDVERVVERQLRVVDRARRERRQERLPGRAAAQHRELVGAADVGLEVGHDHHPLHGRQPLDDLRDLVEDADRLAVVPVAVDGEEHARRDLSEAVEHTLDAEVRRARREHGAARGRTEHGDDGLRDVRHECGDAVADAQAVHAERRGDARYVRVKLAVRHAAPHLVLAPEHERVAGIGRRPALEQVLREIEPRVRKPLRARHAVAVDQHALAALADHAAVLPHLAPEGCRRLDRPVPQRGVVRQADAVTFLHPARERGDVGLGDALRRRLPELGGHVGVSVQGPASARSGPAIASGSGVDRPVARSIHTIFAAPSAWRRPSLRIS